ncbi:Phospholipase A I [Hibiscus syriacus]|uniref:Patatin n=1 Tax=Hibiscus syriacus TaxID=106335 RepID=A0A6A3CNQ8_HIBSY|nr:Phospholipase A I [Hibiscus syriacus]
MSRLIMQNHGNRLIVGEDENTERQLIRMMNSDNHRLVEEACSLSNLSVSLLQVVATMAYGSDNMVKKMLTPDVLRSLEKLFILKNPESSFWVQRLALVAVGNLGFWRENRPILVNSKSLRELLMCRTATPEPRVNKGAARALPIFGENECLRHAIRGRPVPKRGICILSLDGGGMKGLATVQILQEIEKGTGKRMHELFDLICGTSTGGIFAAALGIKSMSADQLEEIYRNLGKVVFSEPVPKNNKGSSWRNKLDRLYRSSSQNFRVVAKGSKDMCADEDGDDLLIETAVKNIPKVCLVSTLASVTPAQHFVFQNYQYPVEMPEASLATSESSGTTVPGSAATDTQSILSAPYYLDDFSDGVYRWLDGALLANNPTIFSTREAQLLWPDTKIDCIVSIGSGSLPTKARKGGMELDETDPTFRLNLEAATKDYIEKISESFKNACERLLVPFKNG